MSTEPENTLRHLISECLSQQLSELDLLKSMYSNDNEVVLTDNNIVNNIRNFLENDLAYTPNHLDFNINISVCGIKIEINIHLPTFYPNEMPQMILRCNELNRYQESKINTDLSNFIKSHHLGEVCLYTAISWLQDNFEAYTENTEDNSIIHNSNELNVNESKFVRMWIYSHHIYNTKKRDEILKKAKELKLTGFCLPGKPGIVCIEGVHHACDEWWKDIKSMNWKKITIRKSELFDIAEQKLQQKFSNFEELHFKNSSIKMSKHCDMSEFSKYMERHGLSQVFKDIFGFGDKS